MERWLNKVSSSLHPVISPRNVDHGNIKKIKISKKSARNHKKDTKARVDIILKYPILNITFL
jgi:hypothetical protein